MTKETTDMMTDKFTYEKGDLEVVFQPNHSEKNLRRILALNNPPPANPMQKEKDKR